MNDRTLSDEKLFYERFWCLLEDRELVRVYDRFGPSVFRRSCVLEGFERFVKENGFLGDTCVEIGTCCGLTAIVLRRYFRQVISIDIVNDARKYEIASFLGVNNVSFVNIHDNSEKAALDETQFDAAFVDGDHAHDTESDFALVKRCGRVLFHEYWAPQPPVVKLVDSLRANGRVQTQDKWALWTT